MSFLKFLQNILGVTPKNLDPTKFLDEKSSPRNTLTAGDCSTSKHSCDSFHASNLYCESAPLNSLRSSLKPSAVYDGGYGRRAELRGVCLRIANGGAGQTGLIQAWADAFIQYMVLNKGVEPFQVAWYLGDTTESLAFLASGDVDVAVTYNPAAEMQLIRSGEAVKYVYAFRDHFMLVGPCSNPAKLKDEDDALAMFSKISAAGDADIANPPQQQQPTRFLSRFDKSATNIKESLIFAMIGKVPWALDYSKWYHQYPRFPRQALETASLLGEYTLTDKGTWLDAAASVTSRLKIFKLGGNDANDILLNPAHALSGKKVPPNNQATCDAFMVWLTNGGQRVIESFKKHNEVLYSTAP